MANCRNCGTFMPYREVLQCDTCQGYDFDVSNEEIDEYEMRQAEADDDEQF